MKKTHNMVLTALFAGIITIMTAYVCHIPIGINGGYLHLGDTFIYLAATILPTPYAVLAAGIGGGLADLLTAPVWMPATIIIKIFLALTFSNKKDKFVCRRNIVSVSISGMVTIVGYALAEGILFGSFAVSAVGLILNAIQAVGSGILFVVIGLAFDKANLKERIIKM